MQNLIRLRVTALSCLMLSLFALSACESGTSNSEEITHDTSKAVPEINTIDRTYVPGKRLGLINAKSTPTSVREAYGEEALVDSLLWGPEGMRYPGFILFGGTDDALEITFDEGGLSGEIFGNGSHWTSMADGIRIGTSLRALNELNGRPFTFSGFDWDYGGNVLDWQGGKLEGHRLQLEYDNNYVDFNDEAYMQLLGDHELSSDLAILKDVGIKVSGIYFILE